MRESELQEEIEYYLSKVADSTKELILYNIHDFIGIQNRGHQGEGMSTGQIQMYENSRWDDYKNDIIAEVAEDIKNIIKEYKEEGEDETA